MLREPFGKRAGRPALVSEFGSAFKRIALLFREHVRRGERSRQRSTCELLVKSWNLRLNVFLEETMFLLREIVVGARASVLAAQSGRNRGA